MFERVVFKYHDLEIRISDHANEQMLEILGNAVQGAEGGLRFSLQNIPSRIAAYKDKIRFVSLYRKNKVTGTIGSCYRVTGQGKLNYPSSYLRYLAMQATYQSDPEWKPGKRAALTTERESSFKKRILDIFSKPHMLDVEDIHEGDKHLMYAFIESMNERSKNLIHQAGYEQTRSFLTVAFSRFSPKPDKRVGKLQKDELPVMEELLKDFYREYSLFNTDHIFTDGIYYVLREDGEIIAGVCALPSAYKVYDVPGVWGWVIMKILPVAPYYRRLFQPGQFRHIVFDAIYYKKGHEAKLGDLFESICATEGYNTGLTWIDDRSTLFDKLRFDVKMGPINRMLNAKPGLVFVKFLNITDEEKEPFYETPAYISGFDFS